MKGKIGIKMKRLSLCALSVFSAFSAVKALNAEDTK